jgi:hypothetical protein
MRSFVAILLSLSTLGSVSEGYFAAPQMLSVIQGKELGLPFTFTPAFDATILLGQRTRPINVTGGILVNEPIIGGSVTGPAINGTILGGFAHPSVYSDNTIQVPMIDIYGATEDGQSFYLHEEGIGKPTAQVTRIVSDSTKPSRSVWSFGLIRTIAIDDRRGPVCGTE